MSSVLADIRMMGLMALLGSVACSSGTPSERADPGGDVAELSHASLQPVPVSGQVVAASPLFGRLYGMVVTDEEIWLADLVGDPFLHQVSLRDGKLIRSVGRKGEGPGEFAGADDLSLRPGGGKPGIWVFDIRRKREGWVGRGPTDQPVMLPPMTAGKPIHAAWLTHDRLISVGRTDTARLAFLDSLGVPVAVVRGPLIGPDSIPMTIRSKASLAFKICVRPDGVNFAVMYLSDGRIEQYDNQAHLLQLAAVPFATNGVFRPAKKAPGQWTWDSPRTYYASCSASADKLYALFSGRLLSKYKGDEASNGRYVHLFDWQGRLLRVLELDHEATTIFVVGDTALYASAVTSDTVYRYRLPSPAAGH